MVGRILKPLPSLVAALLAIGLALLYIDRGWPITAIVIFGTSLAIGVVYVIGRLCFKRWPYWAGFVMEAGLALVTLAAGVAGAVLVWLAIQEAPSEDASARTKEVFAAVSAAIAAYLGTAIINPDQELWNPVKEAVSKQFGNCFRDRATSLEKDARDAVQSDGYGANDPRHKGNVVRGWGWAARRLRTRHIQDAMQEERSGTTAPQ